MRRFSTPFLVLLSASTLFLGACSKDSSDTTAAVDTEAVATDAAVETTAVEATDAAASEATEAAASEAAAGSDATEADVVTQFLAAIGSDVTPEIDACLRKGVPDLEAAITTSMSAPAPTPELLRGMMDCTPDALYQQTAQSIVAKSPEVTEEQGRCLATAFYKVVGAKTSEEFAALAAIPETADFPEDVKGEVVAGAADCGLDAETLTKVINTK